MTVSLGRGEEEVRGAIEDVQKSLRAANAYGAAGRADMGTKMAVRLATDLGKKLGSASVV